MKKSQFRFKKSIWLLLLVVAVFSLFSISSCKEKAPKGSCIALSKSKINKAWVKPGYLKDINYLSFVTFYNPINHMIKVSVQAYKKDYKPIGPLVELTTGDGWVDTLPSVAVGINNLNLVDLDILDKSGKLKDFAYVNLTPLAMGSYLVFDQKVVDRSMKAMTTVVSLTYPCPPCINCKPPCAANCSPPCSQKELDSIKNTMNVINDSLRR